MTQTTSHSEKADQVFARFPRGTSAEARVSIETHRGRTRLDVRVYWLPNDAAEMRPTKKGCIFKIEELPALIRALQQANAVAQRAQQTERNNGNGTPVQHRGRARVSVAEVQRLEAEGLTPPEISARLGCARSTVHRVQKKLAAAGEP